MLIDGVLQRLEAIQNIGSMDVLCTDKTGTLTEDRVMVYSSLSPSGSPSNLPLRQAWVISRMQKGFKNAMDHAVLITVGQATGCMQYSNMNSVFGFDLISFLGR